MEFVLITGASGGIGREIAIALSKEGYGLFLHYHENKQGIQDLVEFLRKTNEHVYVVKADLSQKNGVEELVRQLHTPVDHIVLNSGKSYVGLVTDMRSDVVDELIQLHITSPFLLTKTLLPHMIRQQHGTIVAISSIWGLTGASCEVLYSMLKGGQNTFVKALAKEVAPSGLRVNGVAPGAIDTKMLSDYSTAEKKEICEEIPMGRLGRPEEVAELVAFLVSNKASYVNGQIIGINGAWYC